VAGLRARPDRGTLALYGLSQLVNFRGVAAVGRSSGPVLIYGLDILIRRAGEFSGAVALRVTDFSLSADLPA